MDHDSMRPTPVVPAKDLPRRRNRTGWWIFFTIIALVIAALATVALIYRDTLTLLLHPERIEISMLPETEAALRLLESDGSVRNLRIETSNSQTTISFRSADESVAVTAEYADGQFVRLEGRINAMQTSIQTIPQAEEFAAVMLSPFFDIHEIRAVIMKFSPDIISQAGRNEMDMSMSVGERYTASVKGPPMETVRFTVECPTP